MFHERSDDRHVRSTFRTYKVSAQKTVAQLNENDKMLKLAYKSVKFYHFLAICISSLFSWARALMVRNFVSMYIGSMQRFK